ncbi:MAG: hypothetical protein ACEPOV_13650 [Hyphomicrobiales bacterium]
MKKIFILAITLSVLFTACKSSQERQTQKNKQDYEAEYAKREHELKMQQLELEHKAKLQEAERKANVVFLPCKEAGYDGDDYMGALGMMNGQANERIAISGALKAAKAMIMNRYMGAFKTGLQEYTKSSTIADGSDVNMAKIEGGVKAAGEDAINKYCKIVCQEVVKNKKGGYNAYIAINVSTKETEKEINTKLESLEVDYNADKLFDFIDKELNAQKEKAKSDM